MGNSYQPLTEEQKAIYQSICNEYYDRFVKIVAEGRNLDERTVRKLADGRIYSASQALQHGLIDGLESFDDTVSRMTADLGYDSIDVQQFQYTASYGLLDYILSNSFVQQFLGNQKIHAVQEQKQPQVMMYYGNMN